MCWPSSPLQVMSIDDDIMEIGEVNIVTRLCKMLSSESVTKRFLCIPMVVMEWTLPLATMAADEP